MDNALKPTLQSAIEHWFLFSVCVQKAYAHTVDKRLENLGQKLPRHLD